MNIPEGTAPDELTAEAATELLDRPSEDKILGTDPETGKTIIAKAGQFGHYVTEQLALDAPASAKPRSASLLKSMDPDSVTLEDALRLLTLPRTLGELDGEPVTAQGGARVHGLNHLVLEVAENNENALGWYKKRDFKKLDAAIFMACARPDRARAAAAARAARRAQRRDGSPLGDSDKSAGE